VADKKRFFNPPARVALYCWIGAFIGAGFFLYPLIFPIETYGLGFALNFVGIVIFLTGFISGIVFKKLANKLDELVSGEGLLAHWTYATEEWSRYTEAEHIRDRREKWQLFRLIAIIAVVVGVVFSIFTSDSWLITLVIISALILIIAGVAYFSIARGYKQNCTHPGEVYIGKSGALLGRTFHYWKLPSSFLHSVDLQKGDPPFIELVYSAQSGQSRGKYTARIPIPQGHEAEAKEVLTRLSGKQPDI
jgi:MFS family permease